MTEIYLAKADGVYEKLEKILYGITGCRKEILRTENGKPYIEGNAVFFSLSHSGTHAVIALNEKPVGVDLEIFKNKTHPLLISKFSEKEQCEITDERTFLEHWTAKEAFIKMKGGTIAEYLKRLEYADGKIFVDGKEQNCNICAYILDYGIFSVCTENKRTL